MEKKTRYQTDTEYRADILLKNRQSYQRNIEKERKRSKDKYNRTKDKIKAYRFKYKEEIKRYQIEYRIKNKEEAKKKAREYRQKNKEAIYLRNKKYTEKNKEWVKTYNKTYSHKHYIRNKAKYIAKDADRRARELKQTPQWANKKKLVEIYKNCPKGYHVDHIVPLKGKTVCGFHVEYNLQYLPATENIRKGNKLL